MAAGLSEHVWSVRGLLEAAHFEDVIIVLSVRWYLRDSLSYRDLEEMMAERGLSVDHVTIWRWV
jgi:IS6 family transposase